MSQQNIATMAEALESQLQRRLSGRVHELRVECQTEGVVLRGWTRTYYAKQMAQHVVMDVTDWPMRSSCVRMPPLHSQVAWHRIGSFLNRSQVKAGSDRRAVRIGTAYYK